MDIKIFSTHKAGELPQDYQDAYAFNLARQRFAIADGSTGSFMSAIWSRLLVERFCHDEDDLNLMLLETEAWHEWLRPAQRKWQASVLEIVRQADPAKWWIVNRFAAQEPAIATFVGVELQSQGDDMTVWRARLIGDSCLFHVHGETVAVFPPLKAEDFGYHPEFFASNEYKQLDYQPLLVTGQLQPGDQLLLATDALAKWMLTASVQVGWSQTLDYLTAIQTDEQFTQEIALLRADRSLPLENDDVTLLLIEMNSNQEQVESPPDAEESDFDPYFA